MGYAATGLDFEDTQPVIGVAKSVASVTKVGNNYTVVYDLVVENLGNVAITTSR